MTRLNLLFAVALLAASLPGGLAGPACIKKHFQSADCVAKCRPKWGWSGRMMGTNPWGNVMRKPGPNETLESALSKACGLESTPVPITSQPVVNVQTGSFTLESSSAPTVASASSAIIVPTSSTFNVTPIALPKPTSSIIPPVFSTPSKQVTTNIQPPPPKTTPLPPLPSTSSAHRPTFTPRPSPSVSQAPAHTAPPSTGGGSSGSTSNSDIQAYLSSHNSVRASHGASGLTWSDDLAAKAQQWANNCVFKHSGGTLGRLGENLAAGTGSSYGITTAVKAWTDEVSEYDSSNPVPSHFTQVVWKGTTQVGCAVQSCGGIFDASFGNAKFYVCEYSPAGNIIGQFAQNVQA